jgi:hypothetical protein
MMEYIPAPRCARVYRSMGEGLKTTPGIRGFSDLAIMRVSTGTVGLGLFGFWVIFFRLKLSAPVRLTFSMVPLSRVFRHTLTLCFVFTPTPHNPTRDQYRCLAFLDALIWDEQFEHGYYV